MQGEAAENPFHPLSKTADLYEAGAYTEVNARTDQQNGQDVICEITVNSL